MGGNIVNYKFGLYRVVVFTWLQAVVVVCGYIDELGYVTSVLFW